MELHPFFCILTLVLLCAEVSGQNEDVVRLKPLGGELVQPKFEYIVPEEQQVSFRSASSNPEKASLWIADQIKKQAQAGDAESEYDLGLLTLYGHGVKQNFAEAEKHLTPAFEKGKVDGLLRVAQMAFHSGEQIRDRELAVRITLKLLHARSKEAAGLADEIYFNQLWETKPPKIQETLELTTAWIACDAENPKAWIAHADSLLQSRKYADSLDGVLRFQKLAGEVPDKFINLAFLSDLKLRAAALSGRLAELTDADWELALQREKHNMVSASIERVAGSLIYQGESSKVKAAIPLLAEWTSRQPDSGEAWLYQIDAYKLSGQHSEVVDASTKFLSLSGQPEKDVRYVRSQRVLSAIECGRVKDLTEADWQTVKDGLLMRWGWLKYGAPCIGLAILLPLAIFSRRRLPGSPGWILTILWLLAFLTIGSAALLLQDVWISAILLLAAILALGAPSRMLFFSRSSLQHPLGESQMIMIKWMGLMMILILGFNEGYRWLYELITGGDFPVQQVASMHQASTKVARLTGWFGAAIASPFVEAMVNRGYLHNTLCRHLRTTSALLVGAAVFGLVHGLDTPAVIIPVAFSGLCLGALRVRFDHLGPSFFLHFLLNTIACISVWLGAFK